MHFGRIDSKTASRPHGGFLGKYHPTGHWTPEEIERAFEALSNLPDALMLPSVQGIYRMHRSRDFPNPATSAPGVIVLYDSAFDGKRNISRILGHELAHQVFRDLSTRDFESYRTAVNWVNVGEDGQPPIWIARNKGSFVEEDGFSVPAEDFANNVEYFLFDRNTLRRVTGNADAWIAGHFGPKFKLSGDDK